MTIERSVTKMLLLCVFAASTWACSDDKDGVTASTGGASGSGGATGGTATASGGAGSGNAGGQLSVVEACQKICADQAALSCAFPGTECEETCTGWALPDGTAFPDEYLAMVRCQAEKLGQSDYYCSAQEPPVSGQEPSLVWPAPNPDTACESAICDWTCPDAMYVDLNAYTRCGC